MESVGVALPDVALQALALIAGHDDHALQVQLGESLQHTVDEPDAAHLDHTFCVVPGQRAKALTHTGG